MSTLPPNAASLRGAVDLSSLVNRAPAPTAPGSDAQPGSAAGTGEAQAVQVPAFVLDGTDANFSQFLELSMIVPVIVDLWAEWCQPCKQLTPVLEKLIAEYSGRFVLVKVDVDSNPQLAQAFQAQSIPTVAAVIGGRPVSLFSGAYPEQQVRDVFEQVLQLAASNQVVGHAVLDEAGETNSDGANSDGDDSSRAGDGTGEAPAEPPLPPHHQEAHDAIERGDYPAAIEAFRTAVVQNPGDSLAVAGLAQVSLLSRLAGKTIDEIRNGAAANPTELKAQLLVADLDLSGGHVDDAFNRALELYPDQDDAGKETVRARLLELFQVAGLDDPRVVKARARLTMLLY